MSKTPTPTEPALPAPGPGTTETPEIPAELWMLWLQETDTLDGGWLVALDDTPGVKEDPRLVFFTQAEAEACAAYQVEEYDLDVKPIAVRVK